MANSAKVVLEPEVVDVGGRPPKAAPSAQASLEDNLLKSLLLTATTFVVGEAIKSFTNPSDPPEPRELEEPVPRRKKTRRWRNR